MKKNHKISISLIISVTLLFLWLSNTHVSATNNTSNSTKNEDSSNSSHNIEEKVLPLYVDSASNKKEITIYYIDGSTVPYISVDTASELLNSQHEKALYSTSYDGNHAIIAKGDSAFTADFDFANDSIYLLDFDAFLKDENSQLINVGLPSEGNLLSMYEEVEYYSNERYGKEMTFDFKPYEITFIHEADGYYVPLQTISDLFLTYYVDFTVYNGEAVFQISGGMDDELADIYYSAKGKRTEEFAKFDYNELCFALDHMYGLKETHNITSFDTFFHECGLRNKLSGTDQTEADIALHTFIESYLDDFHSKFLSPSYMTDDSKFDSAYKEIRGPWRSKINNFYKAFYDEREKAYSDGIKPYEEIGNTAYITFDNFIAPSEDIDYSSEPKEDELSDTIKLIQYSRDQILRPDSPIENVVLDLSLNGGGAAVSATYVVGFFMGLGDMNIVNTMTGAATTSAYFIDTNRDGEFDSQDYLAGKGLNLYCLMSPVSFSCGNYVPNAFMLSPKITLLGRNSGGGSCGVHLMSTAGGSMLQISGYKRLSIYKNGSFYDIDRGATPDFSIDKISDYYDREKLTEFINNLY